MQALLFGYGATYDLNHAPYAVLDQSRSAASTELLARLDGAGVFTRAATLTSSDQIASQIDAGKALMVISIPADFQDRLAAGQRAAASHPGRPQFRPPASPAATWRPSWPTSTRGMAPRPRRGRGTARLVQQPGIALDPDAGLIAALSMLQTLLLAALSVRASASRAPSTSCWSRRSRPQILIGRRCRPSWWD